MRELYGRPIMSITSNDMHTGVFSVDRSEPFRLPRFATCLKSQVKTAQIYVYAVFEHTEWP